LAEVFIPFVSVITTEPLGNAVPLKDIVSDRGRARRFFLFGAGCGAGAAGTSSCGCPAK